MAPLQQRRLAAVATLLVLVVLVAIGIGTCGSDESGGGASTERTAKKEQLPQLPGGGRLIFPEHRIVGFYGHPTDDELGELGIGTPDAAGKRLLKQIRPYQRASRKPILPAFELLASIATAAPGERGDHSMRTDDATIRRYLRAARKIDAILILDIQPGYADWMPEVKRLQKWLKQPDVSLALDAEWKVPRGTVPGQVIGSTTAADINEVTQYLDRLTAANRLPQKLLLIHQFTDDMIENRDELVPRKNVAVSINIDGFGGREIKSQKYRAFARQVPWAHKGFKLFYREDTGLMTPRQVLALRPDPGIIVYE